MAADPAVMLAARKSLARQRGEIYLDEAKKYITLGDANNARSVIDEGLRLTSGPFYLSVRDQLEEVKASL